ncbi:MAG TPA: MFS transporter, partial [Steroidobacteraceae bacterium]|nr:MFS transporter [Steroidobacteraceae bacterium]
MTSRTLHLSAVVCSTLGVGLVFGFQPPLLALVLTRIGASSLAVGAVTSVSTIAVIVLGTAYPRVIARIGLRRSVLAGTAIAVVILLAMPAMETVPAWTALRFVNGCALGLAWIASEVWLNALATDESRGRVMAFYAVAFAAGVMAGPVLLEFTGTTGWLPFIVGAVSLAVTAVPLLFIHDPPASADSYHRARLVPLMRTAPIVMLAALIAGLVESADVSLLPVYGLHQGLDDRAALLLVTVFLAGNIVLQLPIGYLADRLGRRLVLGLCAAVSAVGPLLLPVSMRAPWALWPLLLVWGGMMYAFYTQGIAMLGESFPPRELA